MRLVIQRVTEASVTVNAETISAIGPGYLILVGVTHDDD
jgi:D-tyrosyl-tRNA(Tyr) deacylase